MTLTLRSLRKYGLYWIKLYMFPTPKWPLTPTLNLSRHSGDDNLQNFNKTEKILSLWPWSQSLMGAGAYTEQNFKLVMSQCTTKPTKWMCAQRKLRSVWACTQFDQSLLCNQRVAKDPSFLHEDSEDWAHMPVGRFCHVLVLILV